MTSRVLFLIVAQCLSAALCGSSVAAQGPHVLVGPNVRVSGQDGGRAHYEVLAAADPQLDSRLMICSMVETGAGRYATAVYLSHDKGSTWVRTFLEDTALNSFDPSCVFGEGGEAWFLSIGFPGEEPYTQTRLFHSSDSGLTWSLTDTPLPRSVDRPFLAIGRSPPPGRSSLYIHGKRERRTLDLDNPWLEHFWLARTSDGGRSFTSLDVPSLALQIDAGMPAVTSDGVFMTVVGEIAGPNGTTSSLKLVRTVGGGAAIAPPVRIADWTLPVGPSTTRMVSLAAGPGDPNPLYVVWEDGSRGTTHVMFAASLDGGTTWSKPVPLTELDGAADGGFNPAVAVNTDGTVGIQWYDRRDHAPEMGWSVRFTASLDNGQTFLPSVRVAERDVVPGNDLAREGRFASNGGDTAGLAVRADGGFQSAWIDNRTGVAQVWTAGVTVRR
jgi:hypothetical protein